MCIRDRFHLTLILVCFTLAFAMVSLPILPLTIKVFLYVTLIVMMLSELVTWWLCRTRFLFGEKNCMRTIMCDMLTRPLPILKRLNLRRGSHITTGLFFHGQSSNLRPVFFATVLATMIGAHFSAQLETREINSVVSADNHVLVGKI